MTRPILKENHMPRALSVCAALLTLPLLGGAEEAAPTETVIRLTVQPAPAARPALRYQLLPELSEMEPGNAILGYLKCFMEQNHFFFNKEAEEKRYKWIEMPLKDLPVKEIRTAGYRKDAPPFRQADLAARLDHADWQTLVPLRREGLNLLLPEVQQLRRLAAALAVRLRADIAERQFDDALGTAKTLFALARHMGEHPTLIGDLVAIALVHIGIGPLEEMLQQPGCPNLYWALTDLPDPFINLRLGLQGERLILFRDFALLDENAPMTDAQLDRALARIDEIVQTIKGFGFKVPPLDVRGLLTARAKDEAHVRAARERLTAYGLPASRLKQFPPLQVVLLDEKLTYVVERDDALKSMGLPYWQTAKGIDTAPRPKGGPGQMLFDWSLPIRGKVQQAQARVQQRIGLLRCVEALRMYAATHDGRLPARLKDIEVPVPIDPITGRPFRYELRGDTATVRGTPPAGLEKMAPYNVAYVVTIAK
jgi:hypothetical protein